MNARDAVAALEELGVSLHELNDYCTTEGKELNRYALYSSRRVEDILEFKCTSAPETCANLSHLF
jgi:Wiskott-Aldrich syndrome protein